MSGESRWQRTREPVARPLGRRVRAALGLFWACALALTQMPSLADAERAGLGHQASVADPLDRSKRMLAQAEDVPTPAKSSTEAPAKGPTVVEVGLRIHQITDIDQKAERFGAVGDANILSTGRCYLFE